MTLGFADIIIKTEQHDRRAKGRFMKNKANLLETIVHGIFLILGLITVGCVLLITVYLIISGVPAITKIGLFEFLFGTKWASTASEPSYGILPFIMTSIYGTGGAILIGVPVGFFTAVYLAKLAPSLALGATDIETYFKVSVPAAKSGIAAAVVLGVGRAIGEAMAVMMVSGNVPNMPSLFQSVRFLTTAVASEMSYSAGLQRQALFSIALVLFLFIMLINATLNFFLKHEKA